MGRAHGSAIAGKASYAVSSDRRGGLLLDGPLARLDDFGKDTPVTRLLIDLTEA